MTTMQLARRRFMIRLSGFRVETLAFVLVAIPALLAAALSYAATRESPAFPSSEMIAQSPAMIVPPVQAAALIEATAGAQAAAVDAVGEIAVQINAAIPVSAAPVRAAQPFAAPTGGTDYERALTCLTQAVYYEAGFEPLAGRKAVAQVILNRMRHPAFPKSVCGVVYQRNSTPVCQFSFVCDGSMNRAPSPGAWRTAAEIAAAALAGYVEPSVGRATHYHANYVAPRWAPMLAKITQIGAHIFYRWPGAWGQPAAFTGRYIGEPADPAGLRPIVAVAAVMGRSAEGALTAAPTAGGGGPAIARAPNDVGGLLDTSKGWALNIPGPTDSDSAAEAVAASQSDSALQVDRSALAVTAAGSAVAAAAN